MNNEQDEVLSDLQANFHYHHDRALRLSRFIEVLNEMLTGYIYEQAEQKILEKHYKRAIEQHGKNKDDKTGVLGG